jgi:hypothetical protein
MESLPCCQVWETLCRDEDARHGHEETVLGQALKDGVLLDNQDVPRF